MIRNLTSWIEQRCTSRFAANDDMWRAQEVAERKFYDECIGRMGQSVPFAGDWGNTKSADRFLVDDLVAEKISKRSFSIHSGPLREFPCPGSGALGMTTFVYQRERPQLICVTRKSGDVAATMSVGERRPFAAC